MGHSLAFDHVSKMKISNDRGVSNLPRLFRALVEFRPHEEWATAHDVAHVFITDSAQDDGVAFGVISLN